VTLHKVAGALYISDLKKNDGSIVIRRRNTMYHVVSNKGIVM